jgi:hypothetical protein
MRIAAAAFKADRGKATEKLLDGAQSVPNLRSQLSSANPQRVLKMILTFWRDANQVEEAIFRTLRGGMWIDS